MGTLVPPCPSLNTPITVDKQECPQRFGQITKIVLGYRQTANRFTATTILDQTAWQGFLDETDATRLTISEAIGSFTFPAIEPVTFGENSNETPGGKGIITGFNTQRVTGVFLDMPVSIAKQYREFTASSQVGMLEAFFLTETGQIIADKKGANPVGIKIYNWVVSPVTSDGVNAPNKHTFYFSLDGNWDNNIEVYTPVTFNPLDLLATPVAP